MWKLVENPSMRDTDIEAWARAYADANDVVAKWLGPGAAKKLASHAKKKIEEIAKVFSPLTLSRSPQLMRRKT